MSEGSVKPTILVADDSAAFRQRIGDRLADQGYPILVAENGHVALRLLEQDDPPRIALLDWKMPVYDGLAVCRRLRDGAYSEKTYRIVISSRADPQFVETALDHGADDFLPKTLSDDELCNRIRIACRTCEREDSLRASRSDYAELLSDVQCLAVRTDAHGRVLEGNPYAASILGRPARTLAGMLFDEMLGARGDAGRNVPHLASADSGATFRDRAERLGVAWEKAASHPCECTTSHGDSVHILWQGKALKDRRSDGEDSQEYLLIGTDVTAGEKRLALALDCAHAHVFEIDLQSQRIQTHGEPWQRLGYEEGFAAETFEALAELVHPDDRPIWAAQLRDIKNGTIDSLHVESRIRRPDGAYAWFWHFGRCYGTADSEPRQLVGIGRDVTDLKNSEFQLMRREQHYDFALYAAQAASWEFNIEAGTLQLSEHVFSVTGFLPDELATAEAMASHIHPDDVGVFQQFVRALAGGDDERKAEFRLTRTDGEEIWLLCTGSSVKDPGGEVKALYGILIDISEHKRAEEALRQRMREVDQARNDAERSRLRSESMAMELSEALSTSERLRAEAGFAKEESERLAREAEEASRAKSEFLANMSHEIRSPMNGVVGMTDLLLQTELTGEQREYAGTIQSSAQTLLAIINDILDLSKIEANKVELEYRPVDLRRVVEDVMAMLGGNAAARGIGFFLKYDNSIPERVLADDVRLRQIITNLLGNAIKFTPDGHVLLEVSSEAVNGESVAITFRVIDTGVGMTPDQQAKVFEKFSQADASTTRRFGGTGLGLSISRGLVQLFGGTIHIDSSAGRGSTLWFSIPLRIAERPSRHMRQALLGECLSASARGGSTVRRAAVVLPSELELGIVASLLREWKFDVFSISTDEYEPTSPPGEVRNADVVLIAVPKDGADESRRMIQTLVAEDAPHGSPLVIAVVDPAMQREAPCIKELGAATCIARPLLPSRLENGLREVFQANGPVSQGQETEPSLPKSETEPMFDMRILLVEDRKVNQMVAVRMLERFGCKTDVAENGRQAIDAARSGRYDLIFMDCQMPVMDGYDATRGIRRLPEPARDVTIVAMTANALSGDEEKCFASGMDAYLSKPISADAIKDMLERYRPTEEPKTKPKTIAPPSMQSADALPIVDSARLQTTTLHAGDHASDIIEAYVDGTSLLIEELIQAMEVEDFSRISQIAHAIKGECSVLGGSRLSEHAKSLEAIAEGRDSLETKNIALRLIAANNDFCDALRSITQ